MTRYKLDDLLELMSALRDPEFGCPWDLKQDLASLIPYTLEETYEVAETIEQNDLDALRQELGDLLFQVVFYAQIAKEKNVFDIDDVTTEIVSKLLRRHPHVFPDGTLASAGTLKQPMDEESIASNWERIKEQEREEKRIANPAKKAAKKFASRLDDIPQALPAVLRAEKLQSRAARDGFDWESTSDVLHKLREELIELETAYAENDSQAVAEELGDLMFTCVNFARWIKVSPEQSLRMANNKFEMRFKIVESLIEGAAKSMNELSKKELEQLWQTAKELQRNTE